MSEYQYYEFQAIDRPLLANAQAALRAMSTRTRISATSFTNSYEWGDLKGDPVDMMARWFDLHLYLANWGSRTLMIRLPERLVDRGPLMTLVDVTDNAGLVRKGGNLVLTIWRDEVEEDDWDDGSGWLGALAPLRADILSGDLRLFYLLWLMAVQDGHIPDDATEPLNGLGPLTGPVSAFADFFCIGRDPLKKVRRGPSHKLKVQSLVDRMSGRVRSMVVDNLKVNTVVPILLENIEREAAVYTDEAIHYAKLHEDFEKHASVNHSQEEYARGTISTNTVEGYFSIFKRGMKGTTSTVRSITCTATLLSLTSATATVQTSL